MKCWVLTAKPPLPPHGHQDLSTAIKNSCDPFFYQYGNAAGIDQISAVGTMLGLGQKTDLPLNGVAPGVMPGVSWLAQNYPRERWTPGYTANTAIGQGYVLATPLQVATMAAAVANWGTVYQPRLIRQVVEQDGKVLREDHPVEKCQILGNGITPEQMEKVRRGMWRVVNDGDGTARKARVKGTEVAGKTGTAQFWRRGIKDYRTWFVCFAPYDKPRYVVCVPAQEGNRVAPSPLPSPRRSLSRSSPWKKARR